VKLTIPAFAVLVVLPCKTPVPMPLITFTRVLLSPVRTFPKLSSIRSVGCCPNVAPAVAVVEGWVCIVIRLAAPGLTLKKLLTAGLKPASIREKYYHPRSPQGHNLVNRIVDINSYIDHKVRTNVANTGKGPAGTAGSRLRNELAKQGKKLPFLGDDDETANFEYVKRFLMDDFRLMGQQFGLGYAEAFHYIGPQANYRDNIRKYVNEHEVPL